MGCSRGVLARVDGGEGDWPGAVCPSGCVRLTCIGCVCGCSSSHVVRVCACVQRERGWDAERGGRRRIWTRLGEDESWQSLGTLALSPIGRGSRSVPRPSQPEPAPPSVARQSSLCGCQCWPIRGPGSTRAALSDLASSPTLPTIHLPRPHLSSLEYAADGRLQPRQRQAGHVRHAAPAVYATSPLQPARTLFDAHQLLLARSFVGRYARSCGHAHRPGLEREPSPANQGGRCPRCLHYSSSSGGSPPSPGPARRAVPSAPDESATCSATAY